MGDTGRRSFGWRALYGLMLLTLLGTACALAIPQTAEATELRGTIQAAGAQALVTPHQPPGSGVLTRRAGHIVTLSRLDSGALVARTRTDDLGRFAFSNVPPGRYRIEFGFPTPLRTLIVEVPDGVVLELPPIVLPPSP